MKYIDSALKTIYQAISEDGILASSIPIDNYARVWSRDAVMTGIVGVLLEDKTIIDGLKSSLITLGNQQSSYGQIPSNVYFDKEKEAFQVSFGTLSGRVDATTWWIIGACIYGKLDTHFADTYKHKVYAALNILNAWEMNNRGLIDTPMGGNWADEYLTFGYTLYDNVLRYWSLKLVASLYKDSEIEEKSHKIKEIIEANFNVNSASTLQFHKKAYEQIKNNSYDYWMSSFSASGYNTKWDMAGNSLALLLGLNDSERIVAFLEKLGVENGHNMFPVFYPIIKETDSEWNLLVQNHNYHFKNKPYHFHNGGAWPIFLGWLSLALHLNGANNYAKKILENYELLMTQNEENMFREYWDTENLKPHGTNSLCFSAAGYLMMKEYNYNNIKNKLF